MSLCNHFCKKIILVLMVICICACEKEEKDQGASEIHLIYHGLYLDDKLQLIEEPTQEAIDTYWVKQAKRNQAYNEESNGGIFISDPPQVGQTYVEQCRKSGVPIPPPWGALKWEKRGVLEEDKVFQGNFGDVTEVWIISVGNKGSEGVCFALPRLRGGGEHKGKIRQMGIICQSNITGRACFWDLKGSSSDKNITMEEYGQFGTEDFEDGFTVKTNCTACHRGDNAFIVQPDTALDLGDDVTFTPSIRYKPIPDDTQRPEWKNGDPDFSIGCGGCHENFPELTPEYCSLLLAMAGKTMPPPDGGMDQDVRDDFEVIAKKCDELYQAEANKTD